MDSFSSSIKDQLSYNKKIESQIARLAAALPFSTNPKNGNAITTRGGKSTRDPPYPIRTGKIPAAVQEEEEKEEAEESGPQEQVMMQDFGESFLMLVAQLLQLHHLSSLLALLPMSYLSLLDMEDHE